MTKKGTRVNMPLAKRVSCAKCYEMVDTMIAPGYKGSVYCDDCLKLVLDNNEKMYSKKGIETEEPSKHRLPPKNSRYYN